MIAFAKKLRVRTRSVFLAPRGSIFFVYATDESTILRVFTGLVEIGNKTNISTVGAFEEAIVSGAGFPQKSKISESNLGLSRLQLTSIYDLMSGRNEELTGLLNGLERLGVTYPLQIALAYRGSTDNIPFYVALNDQLFEEQGLKVDLVFEEGSRKVSTLVTTGKVFLGGAVPLVDVLREPKSVSSVRVVGANSTFPAAALVVKTDSPIREISDLQNKTVGVQEEGSTVDFLHRSLLRKERLSVATEYFGDSRAGLASLMAWGVRVPVDAAWISEPFATQGVSEGKLRVIAYPEDVFARFVSTVNIISRDYGDENPEIIFAVLRAHRKAIEQMRVKPQDTVEAYKRFSRVPAEVALRVVQSLPENQFVWDLDLGATQQVLAEAVSLGIINRPDLVSFDKSYLLEAAREAPSRADAASQKAEQVRNELRKELQDTFGSLDDYKVSGEATVVFKFNSAKLSDGAKQQLDQLAGQVGSTKRYFVAIQGFTDHIGSEDYNLALSRQRAQAVQNYFVVQHNLPVYRIQIIGLGEQKPADEGRGRDARTKNRRVEVTVLTAEAQKLQP